MQQQHGNIIRSRPVLQPRLARSGCWPALRSKTASVRCNASTSSPFKIKLMHPVKVADADERPLLVFLPGTDGTGQAITPQLPGLLDAGYDVRTLYIPPDDRSGWEQLQAQTLYLISTALGARTSGPDNAQVTIVAESFGGCLALRLAAAAPQLVKALVLVNPATCYNQSLSGLSSFVSATNLLGLFPQDLYNTAQAVLLPFLVDIDRVGEDGAHALRSMIFMDPPPDYETPATRQVEDDDDLEEDASALTIAAERRRLQLNTSAVFTTAGPQTSRTGPQAAGSSSGPRVGASGRSRGRVTAAAAAAGLFNTAAGGAGVGGGSVFAPAAAANFRSNLMRRGNLRDEVLRGLQVPVLLISSAKDRMLPSIMEGARLARLLPRSRRVILPDSGHAALLERGMDLAAVMSSSGIVPTSVGPTLRRPAAKQAAAVASQNGDGRGHGAGPAAPGFADAAAVQPVLLGVVADDAAVPGNGDAPASPRPATLFPASTSPAMGQQQQAAAAAAAAGGEAQLDASGSVTAAAAATSAAAVAAAAAASAGGVASTAAEAGRSSSSAWQLPSSSRAEGGSKAEPAAAVLSNGNGAAGRRFGSRIRSAADQLLPDQQQQQQQQQQQHAAAVDKDLAWDQWSQYLAPWRDLVSPVLLGQQHLPGLVGCGRPLLFVGNHQKCGLYDMPLLAYELYLRGFKMKGLAHPGHWSGPLGPFFEQFGAVKAGPMTAFKLLKDGEQVLLFPGGAREVNKKVGDEYKLFWKDSPDFVRLAARCGAIIVPFAAVGADDAYDVIMDADELLEAPLLGDLVRGALKRVDPSLVPSEAVLPLTRVPGLGVPALVPIPNLQRLYFKICEPVDTAALGLSVRKDAQAWQELYDGIKASVVSGMEELLEVRAADDQRQVGARIGSAISSWLPAFSITQKKQEGPGPGTAAGINGSSSSRRDGRGVTSGK